MEEMENKTDGSKGGDSSANIPSNKLPAAHSRRRLLHLLGCGGVVGITGCFTSSNGGDGGTTEPRPDSGTRSPTETETEELYERATIGVSKDITILSYFQLSNYTRSFEPLIWTTPDLRVKPWLITDWQRTSELTWEFTLREGVQYHNGDRLNADRVVDIFKSLLTKFQGGLLARPRWANTTGSGVKKLGEMTFELTTIEPTANQPANIALLSHFGAHPANSVHNKGDFSTLIGTGPFQIEEVNKGQHVKLSAFKDYWGGAPHMEELTVRQFDDRNTLALALKGNEIDVGVELPANQFEPIENAQETNAATRTAPKTAKIWFNLQRDLFSETAFRKALNYAISQEKVVQATQNGLAIPARGPIPPQIWISDHSNLPTYGPDKPKAKQLLDQSTYTGETLTLLASNKETRSAKLITQVVQQELSEIGLNVEVRQVGINSFYARRKDGDGDLFLGENTMDAPDEPFRSALARFGSGRSSEPTHNPGQAVKDRLDPLFKTARTNTGATRKEALQKAQHIIMEEALQVPLYHGQYVVGMRTGINGVEWHPLSKWTRFENLKYVK